MKKSTNFLTTDICVYSCSDLSLLGLSNPPPVWDYMRSLERDWEHLAKYLGYSESLISHIKNKWSFEDNYQVQAFMRVCLLPDCGQQRTEEIVDHFKNALKSESQSEF